MRKKLALLLLLKLSGLWLHNAIAQSQLSFENYYSMSTTGPLTIMPVASYQTSKGFYAEGRYNYEELNTFSFYMGRTYSKESKFSYSISPVAGIVIGQFNGGSVGANISMGYKNFYLYSQPQYTFAVENSINNFIYSWTDITYSPLSWLSVGVALQHTKPKQSKAFLENGLVIETAFKKFTFPLYIFNPQSKNRSIIVGANFEINFRKKKAVEKNQDPLENIYPVKILANSTDADKPVLTEATVKPIPENVIKVRRVNVLVHQKTEGSNVQNDFKDNPVKNNVGAKPVIKGPASVVKDEVKISSSLPAKTNTPLTKSENKTPIIAKSDTELVNKSKAIQNTSYVIYYALVLGPFKIKADALTIQSKITDTFNRDVLLYSEGVQYKLRVPGFQNHKEAELFSLNTTNEESKPGIEIISYKFKNIDAIPLKSVPKPFEATQL